jgi:hypothetical protein
MTNRWGWSLWQCVSLWCWSIVHYGAARAGRYSVPVLWDKKHGTIVNNESSEILRMFNSAFQDMSTHAEVDLYPEGAHVHGAWLLQAAPWPLNKGQPMKCSSMAEALGHGLGHRDGLPS